VFQHGLTFGQVPERVERLVEPRPRVGERRLRRRFGARVPEIARGLLPQFAAERVMGKLLDVLIEAMSRASLRYLGGLGAHCLQCVDHSAVEEPPARREKPAIRNLAHPIVGEVQLV
jgi:hypothetical protein